MVGIVKQDTIENGQIAAVLIDDLAGVSHATVGGIVKGSRVSQPTAEKVSRALEMPLKELFASGVSPQIVPKTVL